MAEHIPGEYKAYTILVMGVKYAFIITAVGADRDKSSVREHYMHSLARGHGSHCNLASSWHRADRAGPAPVDFADLLVKPDDLWFVNLQRHSSENKDESLQAQPGAQGNFKCSCVCHGC